MPEACHITLEVTSVYFSVLLASTNFISICITKCTWNLTFNNFLQHVRSISIFSVFTCSCLSDIILHLQSKFRWILSYVNISLIKKKFLVPTIMIETFIAVGFSIPCSCFKCSKPGVRRHRWRQIVRCCYRKF